MAKVSVEIRPIELGPYPLVPNKPGTPYVSHEYFECGDPEWCLHEAAPPDEEEAYRLIPVPNAEAPKVFGTDEPLQVHPSMSNVLRDFGFSDRYANGFAIVFHDTIASEPGMDVDGYFTGWGHMDFDGSDVRQYYPLAVHIKSGMSVARTNHVIWHEIGHAARHMHRQQSGEAAEQASYNDDEKVRLTKKLGEIAVVSGGTGVGSGVGFSEFHLLSGYAGGVLGATGAFLAMGGLIVARYPRPVLWMLSAEEHYCERFARKNKSILTVIDNNGI